MVRTRLIGGLAALLFTTCTVGGTVTVTIINDSAEPITLRPISRNEEHAGLRPSDTSADAESS
jgi:hypothetical protein